MNLYISFLRAINVSGKNKIKMAELKALYESLNFKRVQTYIQSGNVLFSNDQKKTDDLVAQIEHAILKSFSLEVKVFVLDFPAFEAITVHNPFTTYNKSKVSLTILSDRPKPEFLNDLEAARHPSEEILLRDRFIFLHCPNGFGRTKLNNALIERKSGFTATSRNWKTITNLLEMAKVNL